MATSLGNIYNVKYRHTENADARFDIRRHDPDQERRRRNDRPENDQARFDTYDNAIVSVDALRAFLEDFLASLRKNDPGKTEIPDTEDFVPSPSPDRAERAVSAQASRAASLYQAAAKTAPRVVTPLPETDQKAGHSSPGPALDNEDVRTIHRLLGDIAILQARSIEYLAIERGETFLASLSAAVEKAKLSS